MSKEQNFAVQATGGEIAASHDFDRFGEVFAQDVIDHDAAGDQGPGLEGVKAYWRGLAKSFPDLKLDVDVLMGDSEYVTIVYRVSGTHEGEYMGYGPTGRHFEVRALQVGKFQDGKIVERWGSTDTLGILAQLGLLGVDSGRMSP